MNNEADDLLLVWKYIYILKTLQKEKDRVLAAKLPHWPIMIGVRWLMVERTGTIETLRFQGYSGERDDG